MNKSPNIDGQQEKIKVIFLDYDGVINKIDPEGKYHTPTLMVGDIMTMADPELVYTLNLLVDRTGAEIVLSSSWRHHPEWRESLAASGVIKPLLDRTPRRLPEGMVDTMRGDQIAYWLSQHPEVEKYAIIDDDSDMLESQKENFFQTDVKEGLTQEIADNIETHLSVLPLER